MNYLGKCFFKKCGRREFDLPNSCVVIGDKSFDWCANLCHVNVSERSELEKIGCHAFRGCSVSDLFLPSGLDVSLCECIFFGVKTFLRQKISILLCLMIALFRRTGNTVKLFSFLKFRI